MYSARARGVLASGLADAFLAGGWDQAGLTERAGWALDRRPDWLDGLVGEVLSAYHRPPADRPRELARFIEVVLAGLTAAAPTAGEEGPELEPELEPPRIRRWLVATPQMGRRRWPVPELPTVGELAAFLRVSDGELAWLADVRGLERTAADGRLRHYWYGTIARPGRPARVIERPKPRLKAIQRRILHEILDWIPAHAAAHGFVSGRSVRSHAQAHVGQPVVLRMDLEDFFGSIMASRIYGVFRTAGYPEAVAHTLTGLSTNVVPAGFWAGLERPVEPAQIAAHARLGRRLATPHLPQGAPTSPALANLAAFRLDQRMSGLTGALGIGITYTRYADDLTFSGGLQLVRLASTLRRAVTAIARDEGFTVNERKTSLVTRAGRQRVCGVVVNDRLNVTRVEYDALKATLHNCAVHGPASQNRAGLSDFRAHLLGRVAWVGALNPERGEKLRRQLAAIRWEDGRAGSGWAA